MIKKINIIFIIFFWLLIGCKKEETETISTGCIPVIVTTSFNHWGPLTPSSEQKNIYDNDNKLLRIETVTTDGSGPPQNYSYEYTDGLISKYTTSYEYSEEYFYNDSNQLIQLKAFQSTDGRITVNHIRTFKYDQDKVVEIEYESELSGTKIISYISYYPNTENIDSVKIYDSKSELVGLDIYEYDSFNHPFKNLILPIYDLIYSVQAGIRLENNLKMRKSISYSSSKVFQYNYEYKYNEYGYPEEIKLLDSWCQNCSSIPDSARVFERVINIDYINCE